METYFFYFTHLVMVICAVIVISATWFEDLRIAISRVLTQLSDISLCSKLKAIYRSLKKEENYAKWLVVSILNIGIQITNQLLK
jgi:hypothetical protein